MTTELNPIEMTAEFFADKHEAPYVVPYKGVTYMVHSRMSAHLLHLANLYYPDEPALANNLMTLALKREGL